MSRMGIQGITRNPKGSISWVPNQMEAGRRAVRWLLLLNNTGRTTHTHTVEQWTVGSVVTLGAAMLSRYRCW